MTPSAAGDIEDIGGSTSNNHRPIKVTSAKRKRDEADRHGRNKGDDGADMTQSWREALGAPPSRGKTKVITGGATVQRQNQGNNRGSHRLEAKPR